MRVLFTKSFAKDLRKHKKNKELLVIAGCTGTGTAEDRFGLKVGR
jgi:hypothetical protein